MRDFGLQDVVRPEKICQAKHPEALQDYSLILTDIDRKAVGALLGGEGYGGSGEGGEGEDGGGEGSEEGWRRWMRFRGRGLRRCRGLKGRGLRRCRRLRGRGWIRWRKWTGKRGWINDICGKCCYVSTSALKCTTQN